MSKIVGIDVGTNSLGITVRDTDLRQGEDILYSTVHQFKSGVGNGKTGEFSLAAIRTEKRSSRKINRVRRYRKWATLRLLIEHGLCPLTDEQLDRWEKYDSEHGRRTYPTDIEAFENWIKCDFDGDGRPDADCINPYAIRAWLATTPNIDFSLSVNRFKLGRALYHIAQRRGFKSSKGERIKEQAEDSNVNEDSETFKASELNRCGALELYMQEHHLPTIGCALYKISHTERIRANEKYQPVRKEYQNEIAYIFEFQQRLHTERDLLTRLLSEKKDGTIFYKRPLKSQKGTVGKCSLEPSKTRCPQSRPEFETFTAWSFINNIRFGEGCLKELSIKQKQQLFDEKFIRATDFQFRTIRQWIEQLTGSHYTYDTNSTIRTINYADDTKVEACVVTYRLQELLGTDWKTWKYITSKTHNTNDDNTKRHQVVYHWEDVWHICFTADDEEPLERFAQDANLDKKLLVRLFNSMPVAYANLSLKAINNINHFLLQGYLYNEACLYAKLPEIIGDACTPKLLKKLSAVIAGVNHDKRITSIANALIASYKAEEYRWADHDSSYLLQQSDYDDVQAFAIEEFGVMTWNSMSSVEQTSVIEEAATLYQQFFASSERKFVKSATVKKALALHLAKLFPEIDANKFSRLYHHSQITVYRPAHGHHIEDGDRMLYRKLLDSPAINALRNPMALRVLHTLRQDINAMLLEGIIDEDDTKIIIEVARELNDANMRWAIKQYYDKRRDENKVFESFLGEFIPTDESIRRVRYLTEQSLELQEFEAGIDEIFWGRYKDQLIKRYRLWREQNCLCFYTGEIIPLSSVLSGNEVDIEHTIPRSRSFDDSMENQTLCKSSFNRQVKRNRMPFELDNYEDILRRLAPWEARVARLKDRVNYWRYRSKKAQDKDSKDSAIRQRHLWEMELQYWQHKVNNFKMKEVKRGFRNSQLVDTSIIAKYATLFLESLFTRVEVQKGSVTAAFRNIIGVPQKTRDNNSHHAVDALILTYIPSSAPREKLLKLYYEKLEASIVGHDVSHIEALILREKKLCGINVNLNPTIQFLRDNVIARYTCREQVITPARRKKKVGHRTFWLQGDSIRGQLFQDNFYGKIMQEDKEKVVIRRGGGYIKFEEKHIKDIIDPKIREAIQKLTDEKGFEQAYKDGFYIIGPTGIKTPIRHVRCEFSEKPVVPVKEHAYRSDKEYKHHSYAVNGEVVLYALYENSNIQEHRCVTLAEVAQANRCRGLNNVEDMLPMTVEKKGKVLTCSFVLHRGTMLILRNEGEELTSLTMSEISKRLYRFRAVEKMKEGKICLQHHLFSSAGDVKAKAESTYTIGQAAPIIIVARGKQKFWIEGVDFEIKKGKIVAK